MTRPALRERRQPTHVLVVEIPVFLDADVSRNYDPLQNALRTVLSVSRLAVDDVLCDDPTVTVTLRDGEVQPR
jgi:hypothetical protein